MMTWEEKVRKVTPYIPGEQPKGDNIIKLNTNENPYPPSPEVERVLKGFDYDILKKYPDPNVSSLRKALADYHGVKPENVFVGVGSDDVLAMAFLTFFNSDSPVFFPDVTYSFYDVWAELFGIPYKRIPLRDDFTISKSDYAKKNGGIVLANPNAPTGVPLSVDNISQILYLNPDSVVIVDEAYVDFYGESAIDFFRQYDNILTVRTFSKSRSLAGSRIGYAVGSKKLIDYLLAVRNSYNSYTIDSVTSAVGIASILDDSYFKDTVAKVVETREWFKGEMSKLGFSFPDSVTNFLFVTHESVKAKAIFEALRERDIFVRYFSGERIKNYLRITIGTREEMESLLRALTEILQ